MFAGFSAVFEALDLIERELENGIDNQEKNKVADIMISLRSTMDRCVQNWLKFEERVNAIQEKYDIVLPDTLPDGFLDDFTNWEDSFLSKKPGEEDTDIKKNDQVSSGINLKTDEDDKASVDNIKTSFISISEEKAITSFRKGLGFWDLAMLDEAVKEFEKVTKMEPNFIIGHFCLGLSSNQKGDHEKALQELKLVTALDSDLSTKALAYNTIGSIYADQGKYQWALENFKKAIGADANLVEAHFNRGAVLYNMSSYEKAVKAFTKVLESTPDDWEVFFYLGKAMGYLGKWDESLDFLEKAYRLNPHEPSITFELGVIHRFLGHRNKASLYFFATQRLLK